jgi:hypothetical protein
MKTFIVYDQPSALDLQPGQKVYPVHYEHIYKNEEWTEVHARPGRKNLSQEVCTSGWLGTTNDVSATALGVFEIVEVKSRRLQDGRERIIIKVR